MTDLSAVSIDDLLSEIRSRDTIVSVWSVEDTLGVIADDEDLEGLSDEDREKVAKVLLDHASGGLEDVLGQRGNDYLADRWYADKPDILAKALPTAPSV